MYSWSHGVEGMDVFVLASGTYTVTITEPNSCSSIFSFEILLQTPTEEVVEESKFYFKNLLAPAEKTNITCTSTIASANIHSIRIFDIRGHLVRGIKKDFATNLEFIAPQDAGLYILELKDLTGKIRTLRKFIVN